MNSSSNSKIHLSIVTFGIIIGIVGILHGSAELLKGLVIVESHSTEAMPENLPNPEFYSLMHGSPVYSLLTGIPHYALGLLAISVSILLIVFMAARFKLDKTGLLLFFLMSTGIFLFGAGRGTPIVLSMPLLIAGILSLMVTKKKQLSEASKKIIKSCFYLFYWLQIFSWVLFFPGLFVLSFYQDIPQWLFLFDFMAMPVSIIGALVAGFLFDKTTDLPNAPSQ